MIRAFLARRRRMAEARKALAVMVRENRERIAAERRRRDARGRFFAGVPK